MLPDSAKLNSDQETAAHTLDRHVSVTAGPGSGKTTVLVARYLHILRTRNIEVDQIVAITFTNRAANEMRTRLRREIDSLMREGDPDERSNWLKHKRALDGAVITTFHGLCARLLREFPLEAEIDPQFALLDETQSAMMIERVAEETLTEVINSGHEEITRLVVSVGRSAVKDAAVKLYRTMRGQGLSLSEVIEATIKSHADFDDYVSAFEEADALMEDLISLRGLTAAAEEKRREAASRWPEVRNLLATIPDAASLAEYSRAIEELRAAARPDKRGKQVAGLVESLDDVLWGAEKKEPFGRLPKIGFDLRSSEFSREMIDVVRQIEQRLEDEKRETAVLDFDDLHSRVLLLFEQRPDVLTRISDRYRFFLVDEFQDTNFQQRELVRHLALSRPQSANLFIVGDRKQSIYGFRGADVDVFRATTADIEELGGLSKPLLTNFRSQRPLIVGFNHLFSHVFRFEGQQSADELNELGWVEHEASTGEREAEGESPIIELLVDVPEPRAFGTEISVTGSDTPRARDAKQIASRIVSLVEVDSRFRYRDIALLFRAMPSVAEYESVFRRLGIPYLTVQGKGFYTREEITDLLQLLRLLDNTTDEIALAAVLRSPLCGLSDEALLALRIAPTIAGKPERRSIKRRDGVRNLLNAIKDFESIAFIADDERSALAGIRNLLVRLVESRNRLPVADLLRLAVRESEYLTVIAANFDGGQRLANVEKLFELAERFERSGANMIRDFVHFVEEFERAGGRESEGQIDETADAVKLMTIHQSKGQEFPAVVIPDLTRELTWMPSDWFLFDRHRGLTVKVPDGRGGRVSGQTLEAFRERAACRNIFEAMRLFYVAATRARDRLILSGASTREIKLDSKGETCMKWALGAIGLSGDPVSGPLNVTESVSVQVYRNLASDLPPDRAAALTDSVTSKPLRSEGVDVETEFPLLQPLAPERAPSGDDATRVNAGNEIALRLALHRFSVTQLVNFQRCPRQYFFDRVVNAPSLDKLNAWNDAEAPEPPANLTASLRGAVVHRFCEIFRPGYDVSESLGQSFDHVLSQRSTGIGENIDEVEREAAIHALLPLAENYLNSEVAQRIEAARASSPSDPRVFDEQSFVIRRPLGTLGGIIDKMIMVPDAKTGAVDVEVIDFKTDRFPKRKPSQPLAGQASFDFAGDQKTDEELLAQVAAAAIDYQLQMQAYALAVRELVPSVRRLRVTLHFLAANVEESIAEKLLDYESCAASLDDAMARLLSSAPANYPTRSAEHCRFCNFRPICVAGQEWFRMQR